MTAGRFVACVEAAPEAWAEAERVEIGGRDTHSADRPTPRSLIEREAGGIRGAEDLEVGDQPGHPPHLFIERIERLGRWLEYAQPEALDL